MEAISEIPVHLSENLPVPAESSAAWIDWLQEQSNEYDLPYLLVHQENGVLWGRVEAGQLIFPEAMGTGPVTKFVSFEPPYIQRLRLFGSRGELFVWRNEDYHLVARLLLESEGSAMPYLDNTVLLWGTEIVANVDGFTLLREGEQGFLHAPPLAAANILDLPASLLERHYLSEEPETGQVYIALSRLVGFSVGGEQ